MRLKKRKIKKKPGKFSAWLVKHFVIVISYFLAFAFGVIITAIFFFVIESKPWKRGERTRTVVYSTDAAKIANQKFSELEASKIHSLHQLLALPPEELEKVDIGLMNLLCTQGLKEAESIDIDSYLRQLDEWAETVGKDVEKLLYKYHEHPKEYDNSENMFRAVTMCYGLKHLFKIHYNLENMESMDYSDSSQIFIHGLLGPKREGSCVSLPVLCAAVGRRLGYPLKLVETGLHLFIRWEDDETGERFNIEVACPGVQTPPDDEYKERPRKLSDLELKRGRYLKSFSAADALSFFLVCRGHNLTDCGRVCEAQVAFANAYRYSPDYVNNIIPLAATVDAELRRMWEEDCELMGNNKIRYTSWAGLRIDKQLPTWSYPPLPGPEFLNELFLIQQELNKMRVFNRVLAEDTSGPDRRRYNQLRQAFAPDYSIGRRSYPVKPRPEQHQIQHINPTTNQQEPPQVPNISEELLQKMAPPGALNSGQR